MVEIHFKHLSVHCSWLFKLAQIFKLRTISIFDSEYNEDQIRESFKVKGSEMYIEIYCLLCYIYFIRFVMWNYVETDVITLGEGHIANLVLTTRIVYKILNNIFQDKHLYKFSKALHYMYTNLSFLSIHQ